MTRLMVICLAVAACGSPTTSPAPSPTPSTLPTPSTSSTLPTTQTPAPATSSSPRPAGGLVLRVDVSGDVDVGVWPDASYYDDGTVITPGDVGEVVVRRLTASGLAELLRTVEISGLLDRPRQFVALLPGAGLNSYTVDVVLPGRAPVRAMAAVNAEVTDDAARFVQLAHDLADPVGSLPAASWADVDPEPFVPTQVRVGTVIEEVAGASYPVDIADIDWPLAQPFDGLGDVLDEVPGYTKRCAVLAVADVDAIRAAFADSGVSPERDPVQSTTLGFGSGRTIRFEFVDLLPDGVPGCDVPPDGPPWWAASGEIAYVEGRSGALRLLNLSDGTDERLAEGEGPAWAPNGDRIALIRPKSDGLPELWLLDVVSGQERRLVEEPAVGAVWSPTGDALAVNRSPIDLGDTWYVGADGTGLRQLADGGDATWSPDGRLLAIVTAPGAAPIVTLVDLATGRLTELAEGTSPAWTDEARPRVAFVQWGSGQVALVDPVTRVVVHLTALEAPAAYLVRVPSPNPPGWALAFVSGGKPWVLDEIDGVARPLSVGAIVDGALSASPDGTWFAVVGRDGDASDLYVVRADGDGWFRLTEAVDVREAAWRPSL